ncbi:MAG: hypothetical protein K0U86_14825 [Planctomycetes bacterium]|nr:hypothetical protein [Planctomycetota bacterium]MCH9726171.1 hypothetical protein [Planctomycetota bacterium]MCH9775676.1 hypothetical protein [Planctomycetota bacterium]MCH9790710.1 hypothetical protein [Planctomycetota bacterium]
MLRSILASAVLVMATIGTHAGEVLYNGIKLPDQWPPRPDSFSRDKPTSPPYLADYPKVIPIDVGRQLFVDDFLIAQTTLKRIFHQPTYNANCPIFKAEKHWEIRRDTGFAAPFSDGVWYDPKDRKFKMWYMAGTACFFGYATSQDAIHWERPKLNTTRYGDNVLDIEPIQRDSSTIWLDLEDPDPSRRFKMMYFRAGLHMRVSADGIHWSDSLGSPGGSSDRSTFFYNPFRKVWVYSIRGSARNVGRCRFYAESPKFGVPLWKNLRELPMWACADSLDRVKKVEYVEECPDLYNLDATPYESLILGLFSIHAKVAGVDRPKINYVTLGFSRDGFHWLRPDRRPFLDVSEDKDAWNYGNVQSAGGGCLVMGDKLYFYCSGRNSHKTPDDGSGATTGLAILRRDGFASLEATRKPGTLTTHLVTFNGKHLFVNLRCPQGSLRAEVLDEQGQPIAPYLLENSDSLQADTTLAQIRWKGATDLSSLSGKAVHFRFHLENGGLYSFWVSPDSSGASYGYVAAGSPGLTNNRDTLGRKANK